MHGRPSSGKLPRRPQQVRSADRAQRNPRNKVGFSPQKRHTSLYLMGCDADARAEMLSRLGPHRAGVGCVYVTRLDAVDEEVLREMIAASYTGTAAQAL